jgi:hypothetical protein
MSNPILPVFDAEPEPIVMDIKDIPEEKEEIIEPKEEVPVVKERDTSQEDIFVKDDGEASAKPRKKRKPMSEAQKEKLKIAREKSLARRREVSDAKKVQKESEKLLKKEKMEAKVAKRLEEDAMIAMKAKMMNDAKASSGWDEDKLVSLIGKTIDSYIEKKKTLKPAPKVHIPHKQHYPQYSPMAPQNQHPVYQPQLQYMQPPPVRNNSNEPYHSLFGFGGQ